MRGTALPFAFIAGVTALLVAAASSASIQRPQVILKPAVALRGHTATITVANLDAPSLEVRIVGASKNLGQALPWTPLTFGNLGWRGVLPAPEFRGIYPIELRVRPGSSVFRSEHWLLHVLARGTQSRPTFGTPEGVARAWVQGLPHDATLVAVKRWQRPAFDLRDPRRHQLLVVAYTLAGHRAAKERLGMFVTAVRDGLHGPWRLLEATVEP